MRPTRILLISLAAVFGLLVLLLAAVVLLVDPNDYKDEIAQLVRDETGRELKLEGDLKLSIFPWLAIETGRAELGNAAGFGATPFLTLERADVGVRLFPLLSGKMQVRRLELDGLQVNLVKNAEGTTNWDDLTKPAPSTAPPPAQTTELPSVAGVAIRNATLDYLDRSKPDPKAADPSAGTRTRLTKLDLETGRIESGEPIELKLQFALDSGEGTAPTFVRLDTEARLDTEKQRYSLKDMELTATLPPDEAKGEAKGETAREAKGDDARGTEIGLRAAGADVDLEAQTLSIPQFALSAFGAELSGSATGRQIVDAPAISGTLTMKPVSARDLLKQLGSEAPQTRDPNVLGKLAFQGKFAATDQSAMLEDLELTLDDTTATGSAGIADFEKTALRFDLSVDRIDVDRYLGPEEKAAGEDGNGKDGKGGEAKEGAPEAPFELPLETLRSLNAQGKLRIGQLGVAGLKMSDVQFSMNAGDGLVRLDPTQAKLYGGTHRGAYVIDARPDTARLTIDEQLAGVDFTPLFADLFDSKRLAGKGNLEANLTARGNNSDALKRTLDGTVALDVADGAVRGADLWYELRRARALWERQPPPSQPSAGETKFRALKATAVADDGVIENRDLIIDAEYVKVTGQGTLEVPTQKIDYRLVANVYKVPPEGAGAEMQSLRATEIPVRVSGTLADPKIRPDLQAQAKAKVQEKIEEKKGELMEKLGGKLGDLLGGRKKKEPAPPPQQ